MTALSKNSGGTFAGIKLLLCENSVPPIEDAIFSGYIKSLRLTGQDVFY